MGTGSSYAITWSYTGNLSSVNLTILDPSGAVVASQHSNIPIGSGKKDVGDRLLSLAHGLFKNPVPFPDQRHVANQRHQRQPKADTVFDSHFFSSTINLPQIKVGSFILRCENVAECSPGRTYPINPGTANSMGGRLRLN